MGAGRDSRIGLDGGMSPPKDIETLSPTELKSLVLKLLQEQAEFRRTIGALRDEIARMKGGPGRPDIKANVKPSGMEKASEAQPSDPSGERRRRGGTRVKLTIDEERKLEADAPPGSRFKGYASFLVQDLMIRPFVTDFLRERWQTPDGKTVTAPLPPGVDGHFGPELRRFVLAQYHQGQVTAARLVTLLRGFGIVISKRQVVRLLIAGKEGFLEEARAVLRAGLTNAAWITVDDTGARHKAKNGFCTQIGNAQFAWFGITGSKSRLNFLELLRAGHGDYIVNDEALAYMRARALAGPVIARLSEHENRVFADRAAWSAHLDGAARRRRPEGPSRSRADRHRRRSVGQRQGAGLARRHRDRQRRRRPVQCRPAWPVLGPRRTTGSQTRYVHRRPTRRAASRPRPHLAVLSQSQGL